MADSLALELRLILDMEKAMAGIGTLSSALGGINDVAQKISDVFSESNDLLETSLGIHKDILIDINKELNRQKARLAVGKGNVAVEKQCLQAVNEQLGALYAVVDTLDKINGLSNSQLQSISSSINKAKQLKDELEKSAKVDWSKMLGAISSGKLSFETLIKATKDYRSALMVLLALLGDYLKLEAEVSTAQFRAHGTISDTAAAVRDLSIEYGINRDTALDTMRALAAQNLGMSEHGDQLLELAGDIGRYKQVTGASTEAQAGFAKALMSTGSNIESTRRSMGSLMLQAKRFGLTAGELDSVLNKVAGSAWKLDLFFGSKAPERQANMYVKLAAMAKRYKISVDEISGVLEVTEANYEKFVVFLGGKALWKEPAQNIEDFTKNFPQIEKKWGPMLRRMPAIAKQQFLGPMAGVYDTNRKLFYQFLDQHKTGIKDWGEYQEQMTKYGDGTAAANTMWTEQMGSLLKSLESVIAALKSAGAALMWFLSPIVTVVGWVAQFFNWLNKISDGWSTRIVVGIIAIAIALKYFTGSALPSFGLFSKLSEAIKALKGGKPPATLVEVARTIVRFINQFGRINIPALAKLGLVILILGGAMVGIGYLAKLAGADLISVGVSLVGLALALKIVSDISEQTKPASIGRLALCALILGVALMAIAGAVRLAGGEGGGGGELLMGALAIVALAGAIWLVSQVSQGINQGGIGALALAGLILAVGLIAIAFAISIAGGGKGGGGGELLMGALAILVLAVAIIAVGYVGVILLGPPMAGLGALAIAGLILAVGLLAIALVLKMVDAGKLLQGALAILVLAAAMVMIALVGLMIIPAIIGLAFLVIAVYLIGNMLKGFGDVLAQTPPAVLEEGAKALLSLVKVLGAVGELGFWAAVKISLCAGQLEDALDDLGSGLSEFAPLISMLKPENVQAFADIFAMLGNLKGSAGELEDTAEQLKDGLSALSGVPIFGVYFMGLFLGEALGMIASAFQTYGGVIRDGATMFDPLSNFIDNLSIDKMFTMLVFASVYEQMLFKMAQASKKYSPSIYNPNSVSSGVAKTMELMVSTLMGTADKTKDDSNVKALKELNETLIRIEKKMDGEGDVKEVVGLLTEYLPEIAEGGPNLSRGSVGSWINQR